VPDVYGPFDGTSWSQSQWYRDAPLWSPSGVSGAPAAGIDQGDLPLTVNGLSLTMGLGRAHVRGAAYERTSTSYTFTVPANTNASLARRDSLVIRRDLAAKTVTPVFMQGTPASTPVVPTVQKVENGQWDIPLFSWTTPANSGTTLTNITDDRVFIGPDYPRVTLPINGGWNSVAGYSAQCFMTSPGRVALNGRFSCGGDFTPDFTQFPVTLPVGYRPRVQMVFVIPMSGGRKMVCTLLTDGRVRLDGEGSGQVVPAGTQFFLDPVVFDVYYSG